MDINANLVTELREVSGCGFMDCKAALVATNGELQAAADFLRKKGVSSAAKKSSRSTGEGLVESYIHPGGKVGVLIEVNCETDFVARTDAFKTLVRDLAMQIAAACPVSVSPDEVPAELVAKEREILTEQAKASGKPEKIIEKMVEGRLKNFYAERCLEAQPFVKDDSQTVAKAVAAAGMKIVRFVHWEIGKE